MAFKAKEGEVTTEQEHKESCDINNMIRQAYHGRQVRGGPAPRYGHDDTTMDGLAFRIKKADLEERLLNGQKEFTQAELDLFPKHIQEQFGYKLKKAPKPEAQNDDQTTTKADVKPKKEQKPKAQDPAPEQD